MRRPRLGGTVFCAALLLSLCIAGCGKKAAVRTPASAPPPPSVTPKPVEPAAAPSPDRTTPVDGVSRAGGAARPSVAGPPIRIGLATTAREVRISAQGGFYAIERRPEATRYSLEGEIEVRLEAGESYGEGYRIQVASLSRREAANSLRDKLEEAFGPPVLVRLNPETSTFQVRVGRFASREEARAFAAEKLAPVGYTDAIVVRDAMETAPLAPRLALRGTRGAFLISTTGFLFTPGSAAGFLRFNGKPYRGELELLINGNGLITVVNQLGIEEYLLGVVPAEISPARYPEFAALAAQSVAARTYALKNMGRFRADGFDLTDDTRTQVYGGIAQERDPTNEAVWATTGVAIYYRGQLIEAMYTSTCGGRTEDFAKVYDAADIPYLRGVICAIEQQQPERGSLTLTAAVRPPPILRTSDGQVANRNLELAGVLGLSGSLAADDAGAPPSAKEVERWVGKAATLAGKGAGSDGRAGNDLASRAGFIRYAAARLFGGEEIARRISDADVQYYLGTLADQGEIPPEAHRTLAFLMQAGLWHPFPDNTARPQSPIARADALHILVHWTEKARPGILRSGTFSGPTSPEPDDPNPRSISIKWGNRTGQFTLAPDVRLFRAADSGSTPVESIRLIGSEKLRFHLDSDNRIDFLEVELSQTGASSDRFSPVATWQVTVKRSELNQKLRGFADSIGEIVDIKPALTGESGRVVRIELVGRRGSTIMNGYRFRGAIGLRDTLFTIAREEAPDGSIESFTFNGRGWGHGVGLCQVGAYGMARAGRSYEEILKTYYQGVELRKAY
ncbi:MAG: SpoIID/LytB domain-containing protein [Acidobacteria bacterium]|nr:SpoIID/LytB domain-containing protein [Acidobacteriota bacterium]